MEEENKNKEIDFAKYKSRVKRKYVKKNHAVGGLLALIFGGFGVYRMYMKKADFILVWFLMIFSGFFFYYVVIFFGIAYLLMSNKKFNLLCLCTDYALEWKVFCTKENNLDALYDELDVPRFETWHDSMSETINRTKVTYNGMPINVTVREKETMDTVRDIYDTVGAIDSDLHEHIKEDSFLRKQIDASQDRLARYQNNDYFPTANKKLSQKEKNLKMKELKEEFKSGLISKEEYDEAIIKLSEM